MTSGSSQDLERERRLLVDALAAAFTGISGPAAATSERTSADASEREDRAGESVDASAGESVGESVEDTADDSGEDTADGGDGRDGSADDGGDGSGGDTGDDSAGTDFGGPDRDSEASSSGPASAVGCACCGCRAPTLCTACPVCRSGAAALDPAILERVADVAVLLAEGLRAAARRLSTPQPESTPQRDQHAAQAQAPHQTYDEGSGR